MFARIVPANAVAPTTGTLTSVVGGLIGVSIAALLGGSFEPLGTVSRPVSLFVGRVSYEKNIEAFLRLELPGTKVVCGVGPVEAQLKQRFPHVHWLGLLPRPLDASVPFMNLGYPWILAAVYAVTGPALHVASFDELDPRTAYLLWQLRESVFVVEQDCAFLEPDGQPGRDHHEAAAVEREGLVVVVRLDRAVDGEEAATAVDGVDPIFEKAKRAATATVTRNRSTSLPARGRENKHSNPPPPCGEELGVGVA